MQNCDEAALTLAKRIPIMSYQHADNSTLSAVSVCSFVER